MSRRTPFGVVAAAVHADAPLALLLLAMVVLGVVLRGYHLADPPSLKWDEHHYVESARSQLRHQYGFTGHPPLGTLIIAASMGALGDRPLAWRLPAFLFGLLNIALGAALAARIFGSLRAAAIAAAFVAVDGFFIAYSRAALLDGMIVAFSLAALLCVLNGRTVWHVIAAGLCAGCAVSVKLNGLVFVALGGAACLASPRLRRSTPLFLLSAGLVFYAQYALEQVMVGRSGSLMAIIRENRAMIGLHLSVMPRNPAASYWYTWFVPLRPIFLRRDALPDGSLRVLLTLGNPLLWWGSTVAVVVAAVMIVRAGPRRLWEQVTAARLEGTGFLCWIVAAWAGPVVFWIPSLRDAYLYHYLPSYTFALLLLAGLLERLYQRWPLWVLLAIVAVAEVSVIYVPLWAELPISEAALQGRLLPTWR